MTLRLLVATFAVVSAAFSQDLPSVRWMKQVDASGLNSTLAGVGTDAQGNVYIAGTTLSPHFPTKNAIQPAFASAGLYHLASGAWQPLGLSYGSALALDARNPGRIFAVSKGSLMKSLDGGATFDPVTLPGVVHSIAIDPANDQILFAAIDGGVLKSVDGGSRWTAANNGLPGLNGGIPVVYAVWLDPADSSVILAETPTGLARSADGGASWQMTTLADRIRSIAFAPGHAGTLYVTTSAGAFFRSGDDGQTFASFSVPRGIYELLPDPIQPGRLIGAGAGLSVSEDGGGSWQQISANSMYNLVADPASRTYYVFAAGTGLVRLSADLQTTAVAAPLLSSEILNSLAVVNGQVYAATTSSTDVAITKLDPTGNIVYSTYLGGGGADRAVAMAVDAAGNVFVTGTTNSGDFPVSKGAYASSGSMFLARLNPDGSLGYSTFFSGTTPVAVATDGSGSAWLLGTSTGNLPTTPGALASDFCCQSGSVFGAPSIPEEASLTRFSPSGSSLTFSTYVRGSGLRSPLGTPSAASALALAPDGSAYVGGFLGIFRVDANGSTLLSSTDKAMMTPQVMAVAPDGTVYAAGEPSQFQATAGAFQTALSGTGLVRFSAGLSSVLAATQFGTWARVKAMATDENGNVYIGGSNAATFGLPTRTPFAGAFANPTGFLSEFSGDLSTLLFSSYFGNTQSFTVDGIAIGQKGDVSIGGTTQSAAELSQGDVWLNSLTLTPPPALRIDSVVNAASQLDAPLASGETIFIRGAGFGPNSQLLIGGQPVTPFSITPEEIAATVPDGLPAAATVEVRSGGRGSNVVLMPVAATSPGIFSRDGAGVGQGYVLNKDGSLNSPSNPARPGDRITVFATGVGPMTFTDCCAVTDYPVDVFIDRLYCAGVAAITGPVSGLPGNVYQITVYVPDPVALFGEGGQDFHFPPQSDLTMEVNRIYSPPQRISISIAQ